jgi:hypothetical protein
MRLVDFCNPHFKDEHPSHAWIPAFITLENRTISRHPARFAQPDHDADAALRHRRIETAEALTPLSPSSASSRNSTRHQIETGSTNNP